MNMVSTNVNSEGLASKRTPPFGGRVLEQIRHLEKDHFTLMNPDFNGDRSISRLGCS